MDRISLFQEYRLIERSELEISGAWKGAHLLLFFMAFVFGSFCTFCFHMLMYLFDENCVLFPKLLSLTSLRHNVIYEFIPVDKETADMLPVDFIGTQWMEKSACYLPTYVPLVSGIFGLVWTTMFLMCSTGSRTLTGLQRPWRVLPPVFLFSLAMGGLCVYSSAVTYYGLNELCIKLGKITGSATCTYTVNVATLAYERRIRGVYQAIRLTILSAWLHTLCWLLSAVLTLARVIFAIDFQLVRINVDLIGNIDKMLEKRETQIRTVSPDAWFNDEITSQVSLPVRTNSKTQRKTFSGTQTEPMVEDEDIEVLYKGKNDSEIKSKHSLVPEEEEKLARRAAYEKVPKDKHFIVKMVYDLVKKIWQPATEIDKSPSLVSMTSEEELLIKTESPVMGIVRQKGRQALAQAPKTVNFDKAVGSSLTLAVPDQAQETTTKDSPDEHLYELHKQASTFVQASTSTDKKPSPLYDESTLNITEEMKSIIEAKRASVASERQKSSDTEVRKEEALDSKVEKKSNLKNTAAQTDTTKKKASSPRVQIAEPADQDEATETVQDAEKETQTSTKKEKQD